MPGCAPVRVIHGALHSPGKHLAPVNDARVLAFYARANIRPIDYGRRAHGPDFLTQALAQIDEPVLVCGHSHVAWMHVQGERLALNPGSVGTPINDDTRAQYALLGWSGNRWQVELRAVPYCLARVRKAYEERGLLAQGGPIARASMLELLTARPVLGRFVSHVLDLARKAGVESSPVVPDAVWERAIDSFEWLVPLIAN
jgi:hypothetical protein